MTNKKSKKSPRTRDLKASKDVKGGSRLLSTQNKSSLQSSNVRYLSSHTGTRN